jgi:uncharacterized protein (TIGR00375 family)
MHFHADLHVHSKYSRATSRDLDLEHLAIFAARKGVAVVGTGDFTHPAWRAELKQKLVPAESGLFRLDPEIERSLMRALPPACVMPVRFMLSVEVSTIYKKGERTRKIHHLIYAPDFATVDRLSAALARIGNIASDGRPILGLDSRDLLEITLESNPDAYLVPAHVWTPWFAVLGSQSGFDSIEECYGDLTNHIFAVETGLSSDPAMNWRVSLLDRYRLVSNSDAHSPAKVGREATTFSCDIDYFAIRNALLTGEGFRGTVEFFPEEGKYHLDGHRSCGVRLSPQETRASDGRCPACGEPVTVGVLHRVETLADRVEPTPPPTSGMVSNLVPLPEILSEITGSGPGSRAVERSYERAISTLGSELSILEVVPIEDIARTDSLLGEAVARLRAGRVIREAGYDGVYGTIRLFEEGELRRLRAGSALFEAPTIGKARRRSFKRENPAYSPLPKCEPVVSGSEEGSGTAAYLFAGVPASATEPSRLRGCNQGAFDSSSILSNLDADQRRAAEIVEGPLLIIAGPGSGKTRTLTHRIAHLVVGRHIPPSACLAITFTRRAAAEMRERLKALMPSGAQDVAIHTFHSLGLQILRENPAAAGLKPGFRIASERERLALITEVLDLGERKAESALRVISGLKRMQTLPATDVALIAEVYGRTMAARNWVDFDDLIGKAVHVLESDDALAARYRERFFSISVDELQDVDPSQYRLIMLLASPAAKLCLIGDPDQAIYGFRGADATVFERFKQDFPDASVVHLRRNYRSSGTIVRAASQVIMRGSEEPVAEIVNEMHERIAIHTAPTERAEAEFVVQTIERLMGGHTLFSIDSGRARGGVRNLGFSDFAVLYRTDAQAAALCEALTRSGIPFGKHSHSTIAELPAFHALLRELERAAPASITQDAISAAASEVNDPEVDKTSLELAAGCLIALAEACGHDCQRFGDALALATEADFRDPRADCVSLLTLHAAKGLEFPVVFIVGLEEGILPLLWEGDQKGVEEERRLLYVGMTRAMSRLVLSRAERRVWRGRLCSLPPSRFLNDIEVALTEHRRVKLPSRRRDDRQLTLL